MKNYCIYRNSIYKIYNIIFENPLHSIVDIIGSNIPVEVEVYTNCMFDTYDEAIDYMAEHVKYEKNDMVYFIYGDKIKEAEIINVNGHGVYTIKYNAYISKNDKDVIIDCVVNDIFKTRLDAQYYIKYNTLKLMNRKSSVSMDDVVKIHNIDEKLLGIIYPKIKYV